MARMARLLRLLVLSLALASASALAGEFPVDEVVQKVTTLASPDQQYSLYLPPCYESETERRYPVLYLLPGLGGGPGDWFAAGADKTADELILNGEIPPLIIVTTESTAFDRYGDAILNDLLPGLATQLPR